MKAGRAIQRPRFLPGPNSREPEALAGGPVTDRVGALDRRRRQAEGGIEPVAGQDARAASRALDFFGPGSSVSALERRASAKATEAAAKAPLRASVDSSPR